MSETGEQKTAQNYTPLQRIMTGFFTLFLLGFLAYFAVLLARSGLAFSGSSTWIRVPLFVLSGLMMFAAARWIFVLLRRKLRTGRFLLTGAEIMARTAEYQSKVGAGKPFGPQVKYWIVPLTLMTVLLGLGIAAIVASMLLWTPVGSTLPLLAIAALLLFLPGWFAFKTIQRKLKTGSVLPSQEELAKARAKCATPKSLRQRILFAGMYWVAAILWTLPILRGHHSQSQVLSPWILAALWWFAAILWTWQVFRPSKPQCSLSIVPEDQPAPPEVPSH